jgi:hypothetical protein
MIQELFGSVRIELPEDPRQSAKILAEVATAWASMLETIGLEVEASLTINEGRKQRGQPRISRRSPRLVTPSGEAA